jgi:hypothetical protein
MKFKKILLPILSLALTPLFFSCEDVIDLSVKDGVEQLVVDAWLTDENSVQTIKLTLSQPYFDNSAVKPALGATVIVFEEDSTAHTFVDKNNDGNYSFTPLKGSFLKLGKRHALYIKYKNEEYYSISTLPRVPKIDSLTYEEFRLPIAPENGKPRDGFLAQFYAKDPIGEGDTYWVKSKKNGKERNLPSQISIAYDAGFSPGSKSDGLLFILPVRQSINGGFDDIFYDKDTVSVELRSISNEAFYFLLQVRQESSNGGIFGTPPANIPTNIFTLNSSSKNKALGFFAVSSVSKFETIVDKNKAKPKQ